MTSSACSRSRFVEKHVLSLHFLDDGVTAGALHARMPTLQGQGRSPVVVKQGWSPPLCAMAVRAGSPALLGYELAAVRINVATFAALCRAFELDFPAARKRLVARPALHNPVGP